MTPAGKRNRQFRIMRAATTKTARGSMVPGAAVEFTKGWAAVNYGTGAERRRAGAENSEVTATMRVLATPKIRQVTANDLCELDGATWNVTGSVPWGNAEIDITIIRRG